MTTNTTWLIKRISTPTSSSNRWWWPAIKTYHIITTAFCQISSREIQRKEECMDRKAIQRCCRMDRLGQSMVNQHQSRACKHRHLWIWIIRQTGWELILINSMKCQIYNRHQLEQGYRLEENRKDHLRIHKTKYNQRRKEEHRMILDQSAKTLGNHKTWKRTQASPSRFKRDSTQIIKQYSSEKLH